jgi:hypothetical protein
LVARARLRYDDFWRHVNDQHINNQKVVVLREDRDRCAAEARLTFACRLPLASACRLLCLPDA